MKACGEWVYRYTFSLASALLGGELSTLCPGRFNPEQSVLGTHWIGVCVDPRAGVDVDERNFLTLSRTELRSLGRLAVASRYTDRAIPFRNANYFPCYQGRGLLSHSRVAVICSATVSSCDVTDRNNGMHICEPMF